MYAVQNQRSYTKTVRITVAGMRLTALAFLFLQLALVFVVALPALFFGQLSALQVVGGIAMVFAGLLVSATTLTLLTSVPRAPKERQAQFEHVIQLMIVNALVCIAYTLFL